MNRLTLANIILILVGIILLYLAWHNYQNNMCYTYVNSPDHVCRNNNELFINTLFLSGLGLYSIISGSYSLFKQNKDTNWYPSINFFCILFPAISSYLDHWDLFNLNSADFWFFLQSFIRKPYFRRTVPFFSLNFN